MPKITLQIKKNDDLMTLSVFLDLFEGGQMKPFIKQSLLLGGFYFFVAYIIGHFAGNDAKNVDLIVITLLLITVIVLAFKKSFASLAAFWNRFPKISTYLAALGVIKYFSIIFGGIPGAIDGYILATATDVDWYQMYYEAYIPSFICVYWIVFWCSLFGATYFAFFSDIKLVKIVEVPVAGKANVKEKTAKMAKGKPNKKPAKKSAKRK